MSDDIRRLVKVVSAFLISAVVGELASIAFNITALRRSGFTIESVLSGSLVMIFLKSLLILPFWVGFVVLANSLRVTQLIAYLTAGAVLGVLLGTTVAGLSPQMFWESGPIQSFGERWLQAFNYAGIGLAVQGAVACTCYWSIAVRRR